MFYYILYNRTDIWCCYHIKFCGFAWFYTTIALIVNFTTAIEKTFTPATKSWWVSIERVSAISSKFSSLQSEHYPDGN